MNNDRQTYSDSDMQDYELKKYVFRKRKVSANRKKRSFPLVIKSCKMCGKYIYNDPRYDSYCKSCYDVNQNDEFVCIRLNYLLLFHALMVFVCSIYVLPIHIFTPLINIFIDYQNLDCEPDMISLISIGLSCIINAYYVCFGYVELSQFYIYYYIFVPVMVTLYGYDRENVYDIIKKKYKVIHNKSYVRRL